MSKIATRLNKARRKLIKVNLKLARGNVMSRELHAEFDKAMNAANSAVNEFRSLNTPTRAEKIAYHKLGLTFGSLVVTFAARKSIAAVSEHRGILRRSLPWICAALFVLALLVALIK